MSRPALTAATLAVVLVAAVVAVLMTRVVDDRQASLARLPVSGDRSASRAAPAVDAPLVPVERPERVPLAARVLAPAGGPGERRTRRRRTGERHATTFVIEPPPAAFDAAIEWSVSVVPVDPGRSLPGVGLVGGSANRGLHSATSNLRTGRYELVAFGRWTDDDGREHAVGGRRRFVVDRPGVEPANGSILLRTAAASTVVLSADEAVGSLPAFVRVDTNGRESWFHHQEWTRAGAGFAALLDGERYRRSATGEVFVVRGGAAVALH